VIQGRTILCFGSGYDAPPTSKHHVMHLLAERNTVLWVNYHASRAPTASSSDLAYIARKLRQVFGGIKKPRQNLYVLTPLVVPLPSRPWARRLNHLLLIRQVSAALRRVGRGPVLHPRPHVFAERRLGEHARHHSGMPRGHRMEAPASCQGSGVNWHASSGTSEVRSAMIEGRTILCFASGYDAPLTNGDRTVQWETVHED
jgi:hypothetical protein